MIKQIPRSMLACTQKHWQWRACRSLHGTGICKNLPSNPIPDFSSATYIEIF